MQIKGSPSAPSLHNTAEKNLFWIVGDVWTKSIDCLAVISITVLDKIRFILHVLTERFENFTEGTVVEFASKSAKLYTILVLPIS
jgi:hypothetical protein